MNSVIAKTYFNCAGYAVKTFPRLTSFVLPKTVVVEATNMCMLKCPACATTNTSRRKKGVMPYATFKHLIDGIDWKPKRINFSYAGEPLLNTDLSRMIEYAAGKGIDSIVETNGMLLEKYADDLLRAGLYKLIIAFDGINQETVSKYRKGIDFDAVLRGIHRYTSGRDEGAYPKSEVGLQFIVMKHNQHLTDKAVEMAGQLRVDYIDFKSMALSSGSGLSSETMEDVAMKYLPDSKEFTRYKRKNGKWRLIGSRDQFCTYLTSGTVIMWDGNVTICSMDVEGNMIVGNIFEKPLRKIWLSNEYFSMRKKAMRRAIKECKECGYLLNCNKKVHINKIK